jgi:hypothetical protein
MKYQIIDMPKAGKEQGLKQVVPVWQVFGGIEQIEIPYFCNIKQVIILYGDLMETKKEYAKLHKKRPKGG